MIKYFGFSSVSSFASVSFFIIYLICWLSVFSSTSLYPSVSTHSLFSNSAGFPSIPFRRYRRKAESDAFSQKRLGRDMRNKGVWWGGNENSVVRFFSKSRKRIGWMDEVNEKLIVCVLSLVPLLPRIFYSLSWVALKAAPAVCTCVYHAYTCVCVCVWTYCFVHNGCAFVPYKLSLPSPPQPPPWIHYYYLHRVVVINQSTVSFPVLLSLWYLLSLLLCYQSSHSPGTH